MAKESDEMNDAAESQNLDNGRVNVRMLNPGAELKPWVRR
jgi:hypothetical protein